MNNNPNNSSIPPAINSPPHRSRYRGVYRCGKRWKAQLQSQGVQFYLGTFDSEEEAARAYDRKARDEKGFRVNANFEGEVNYSDGEDNEREGLHHKRKRNEESNNINNNDDRTNTQQPENVTAYVSVIWERLVQVSERIILANSAFVRMNDINQQQVASTLNEQELAEQEHMIHSLHDEIVLLTIVKSQLEECISRCITLGLKQTIPESILDETMITNRDNNSNTSLPIEANSTLRSNINDLLKQDTDRISLNTIPIPMKNQNNNFSNGNSILTDNNLNTNPSRYNRLNDQDSLANLSGTINSQFHNSFHHELSNTSTVLPPISSAPLFSSTYLPSIPPLSLLSHTNNVNSNEVSSTENLVSSATKISSGKKNIIGPAIKSHHTTSTNFMK
eukprot:gene4906-6869_t